jgi:recombination protein RecA
MSATALRAQIEARLPAAFACYRRPEQETLPTGIPQIDGATGGVPLRALTEICGSHLASSGKTSVLVSLLAQASQERFCALVDASDAFDPATAEAAGVNLPRLCWVRCGKSKTRHRPLEQAFKTADLLLQNGGFGLIAVDLSGVSERFVAQVPMITWFRFSRVVERQECALVFVEREPHATSCAGLVLRMRSEAADFSGNLLAQFHLHAELGRTLARKPAQSEGLKFSLKPQWA